MTDTYEYGLPPIEQVATMSGRDVLQSIVDGRFPQAPISETLSFWIVEVGEGTAVFEGEPGPHLCNPMGSVHGGWSLTLIDSATGSAGYSTLPPGVGYTTIETKGNLSRPIGMHTGRVRAEAHVIAAGKQVISAECTIRTVDGKVVAHGTSTLLILRG